MGSAMEAARRVASGGRVTRLGDIMAGTSLETAEPGLVVTVVAVVPVDDGWARSTRVLLERAERAC
jgi:hypothetical protein